MVKSDSQLSFREKRSVTIEKLSGWVLFIHNHRKANWIKIILSDFEVAWSLVKQTWLRRARAAVADVFSTDVFQNCSPWLHWILSSISRGLWLMWQHLVTSLYYIFCQICEIKCLEKKITTKKILSCWWAEGNIANSSKNDTPISAAGCACLAVAFRSPPVITLHLVQFPEYNIQAAFHATWSATAQLRCPHGFGQR